MNLTFIATKAGSSSINITYTNLQYFLSDDLL